MAKLYTEYEGHPQILSVLDQDCGKVIEYLWANSIINHQEEIEVFDLLESTYFGLLEDLVPGSELIEQFLRDFANLQGIWVYYPRKKHLVKFAPLFWHRLALLVRNSMLIRDEQMKMKWEELREIFEKTVIAVAGCSVGANAAHAAVCDLRPKHIKIADPKEYHLNNANRIRLTYEDFGRNKAIVTAEQIHAIDPFINISVFPEGVHCGNVEDFIAGNKELHEPSATVIIEESDDPDIKILIREQARKYRVPVIMVTDLGSAAQIDIRRFDVSDALSLAAGGVSDAELYRKRDEWRADLANRAKFHEFAFALIGRNYEHLPEFKRIIFKEEPPIFGGIPQLGSTAIAAGGFVAEAVSRLSLGFKLPERIFVNKHTGQVLIEGRRL